MNEYSRDAGPLGLVVTTVAGRLVKNTDTSNREYAITNLLPGERIAVPSPLTGNVMAMVSRTKDDKVAEIHDKPALMAHLQDTNPDALVDVDVIVGTTGQIVAVLKEHAPHLVESEPDIAEHETAHILRQALEKDTVLPPGVRVRVKSGYVRVDTQPGCEDEVRALIAAGRVAVDGSVLPEIEGGTTP